MLRGAFKPTETNRPAAESAVPPPRELQLSQPSPAPGLGDDERFMAQALALAARGVNTTHPNPRVGCVVVHNGVVVGEGWHRFAGEAHAEIIALARAAKRAKGAIMYSTLEPCCHHGRTPPCVQAVRKAGIRRAVIAMQDPNPQVNGAGIAALERAGIAVTLGVGKPAAHALNRGFYQRMVHGKPWVTLKMAVSLDGKTALASGESQWITSAAARRDAHQLRAASSAILTGVGTVLRDDPKMTVRLGLASASASELDARQPLRVILDSHLSTPAHAKILHQPGNALIITAVKNDAEAALFGGGSNAVEVLACRAQRGQLDLQQVLAELAKREVNELLVEAGARLSGSMLEQQLVDQVIIYLAPDLLGDEARGMFNIAGLETLADRRRLTFREVRRVGRDLRLSLDVVPPQAPATAAVTA